MVFDKLVEKGLLNDWRQEAVTIALEAEAQGLNYGDAELPRYINNRWYTFLSNYGFVRPRNSRGYYPDVTVSSWGEDFLEKAKEVLKANPIPLQPTKEHLPVIYHYNSRKFLFTSHFIERWNERINLKFQPRAVIQQLNIGKELFTVKGKKGTQKRVKCPWFVLQVSEKKNHTVFITVWK